MIQAGPTTTLSRNNVLQWYLKGIEIMTENKGDDDSYSTPTEKYANNASTSSGSEACEFRSKTYNEPTSDTFNYFAFINAPATNNQKGFNNVPTSGLEDHTTMVATMSNEMLDKGNMNIGSNAMIASAMNSSADMTYIHAQPTRESQALKIPSVSHKQEAPGKKVNEAIATKGARKKRVIDTLVTGAESSQPEKKENAEAKPNSLVNTIVDGSALQ